MIKRVCDRCGKDVPAYYRMDVIRGTSMLVDNVDVYDLCDECWEDFLKFMEQKPLLKREGK